MIDKSSGKTGFPFKHLGDNIETTSGYLLISTMRLAKGLEFGAVSHDGVR